MTTASAPSRVLWDEVPEDIKRELDARRDLKDGSTAIVERPLAGARWYFRRTRYGWNNLSVDRAPAAQGVAGDLDADQSTAAREPGERMRRMLDETARALEGLGTEARKAAEKAEEFAAGGFVGIAAEADGKDEFVRARRLNVDRPSSDAADAYFDSPIPALGYTFEGMPVLSFNVVSSHRAFILIAECDWTSLPPGHIGYLAQCRSNQTKASFRLIVDRIEHVPTDGIVKIIVRW